MPDNNKDQNALDRLRSILARLRAPGGCQWDRAQTHKSLVPYLIEETYEVIEAIEEEQTATLKEELGDLLMHVFFHAQIASETGEFTLNEIAEEISDKLVKRHPHVFGDRKDLKPQEVRDQWEKLKVENGEKKTVLGGLPKSMPALIQAYRVGEKAGGVGFDWRDPRDIFGKFKEEIAEFEAEFDRKNRAGLEHELGDLIFALVNLARKLQIDPERALRLTVSRFITRFAHIEKSLKEKGQNFSDTTLEEMEALWEESKR